MSGARHLAASRRVLFVTGIVVVALAGVAIASSGRANIRLGKTSFGVGHVAQTLQTGDGYAIYMSTHDRRDKSRCSGRCTLTFKPVITHGRVRAWSGVKQQLVGAIDRGHNVEQVTYNHHPLYTSTDDSTPGIAGDASCTVRRKRWGTWYVVRKNGNADKHPNPNCIGY